MFLVSSVKTSFLNFIYHRAGTVVHPLLLKFPMNEPFGSLSNQEISGGRCEDEGFVVVEVNGPIDPGLSIGEIGVALVPLKGDTEKWIHSTVLIIW